jgi:hypothetical protein
MAPQQQPSNQAVQQQQARQAALTALLATAMLKIWPLIDLSDLKGSLPRYEAAVTALVHKYGQSSAVLAARFYQQERAAAGIAGRFLPEPANPAPLGQVQASIGWATKGLWSQEPEQPAAKILTNGVAQKLVVDTGRNTLIAAIEADKHARGWARQARPDACSFCSLLSTRGAVYRSEQTAGFEAHNDCHCIPVPVFADHYEPPAYVRQWEQIYRDSTRGKSGAEARNAFRVALDQHRNPSSAPAPEPALT